MWDFCSRGLVVKLSLMSTIDDVRTFIFSIIIYFLNNMRHSVNEHPHYVNIYLTLYLIIVRKVRVTV